MTGVGGSGGPTTGGGGAGGAPSTARGKSAKSLFKLSWQYPVYEAPKVVEGPTAALKTRKALPTADALAYLAGNDPRPLLVLRECKTCNGTDDALLSRGNVDNERTFLLSRWYHCVKLPVDVLQKDHPFHNLFRADDPEHMFLCAADGTSKTPLESERSRVELWDAMVHVLTATYAKEPDASLKMMQRTIDALDLVDDRIGSCERRIDMLLETDGPQSPKMKKAKQDLEAAHKERDALLASIDRATSELKLKPALEPKSGGAPKDS
jgi:hypothetical protein